MPRTYDILKKMNIMSEDNIQEMVDSCQNLMGDDTTSMQDRLNMLSRMSGLYFDTAKLLAVKILSHINLYGLGVQGATQYIAGHRKSNSRYDKTKSEIADQYRVELAKIQQLDLYKVYSENIDNFIKKLYELQTQLKFLINSFQPHKGGKIGAIILSKDHQVLMKQLGELYVFLVEKENAMQDAKKETAAKYLAQSPKPRPQARQYQIVGALDLENQAEEARHKASGNGLFNLMKQQERVKLTGIDAVTARAEAKFEAMVNRIKTAKLKVASAALAIKQKETLKPEIGKLSHLKAAQDKASGTLVSGYSGKLYQAPTLNSTKPTVTVTDHLDHKYEKR
jgi:hypothetical protein